MNFGLKDSVIEKIQKIFLKYHQIKKVILYGSRAKGNYKNGSDIDITLIGDHIDLTLLNKISNDIDDLLLPYSFDISIFEQLTNQDLVKHIKRIGIDFYIKEQ